MHRVLIATDLAPAGTNAMHRACLIGSQHCADLTILHATPRMLGQAERSVRAVELDEIAEAQAARHPCLRSVAAVVATGRPSDVIASQARLGGADLIVVGAHGPMRWGDELFGTTVENLVRRTRIPVLVVRTSAEHPYHRVVAAIEGETLAAETLDLALAMGAPESLYAVHAFLPTLPQLVDAHGDAGAIEQDERDRLHAAVERSLRGRGDVACAVHSVARPGDPLSVIIAARDEFAADLVVAVTHGRTGVGLALRGSLADMLIEDQRFDLLLRHAR